jgi:CRISPR-associated protein Csd2
MRLREVFIFRHDDPLGNAHAGKLFDRVTVRRKAGVEAPRRFEDYDVTTDEAALPPGVTLVRLLG